MKITIVHQEVPHGAATDELDVLEQAAAIREALVSCGHAVTVMPCNADLGNLRRKLTLQAPDCIFNLVETLENSGRLIHLAPAVWEAAGIPFTGSSAEALYLTTQKLLAKQRLAAAGLPTPEWVTAEGTGNVQRSTQQADWIVKSVWEHASIGLDDQSLWQGLTAAEAATRLPPGFFAERFIDGREFNLALMQGPEGPEFLPPAEIVFEDYPAGKPKIVGYQAKWDEASFEFKHTVRRFVDTAADRELADEMKRLALRCWELFGLGGYARVDFRVDQAGRPWILEVNSNPCLAPDSGFAAALAQAGIGYGDAMERIVQAALRASGTSAPTGQCGGTSRTAENEPCERHALRPSDTSGRTVPAFTFRHEVMPPDVAAIRDVTAATGYFHDHEIDVAVELVEERLSKGAASGYEFVIAECGGQVVGYTSFGPVPCTESSFDWYWLAVRPEFQGIGLGKHLLRQVLERSKAMGGTQLFCETSASPQYASTRAFYERMGFTLCEILEDFYAPGDGRATYRKSLRLLTPNS